MKKRDERVREQVLAGAVGRPAAGRARSRPRPIAGESMFDECVGVTTIVPRSAHARTTSSSPSAWIRASRLRSVFMPSRRLVIGVEQEAEQRRADAGRELVDARIEVADDVAGRSGGRAPRSSVVLLLLGHREQPARQIRQRSSARRACRCPSSRRISQIRDVVEHVLERVHRRPRCASATRRATTRRSTSASSRSRSALNLSRRFSASRPAGRSPWLAVIHAVRGNPRADVRSQQIGALPGHGKSHRSRLRMVPWYGLDRTGAGSIVELRWLAGRSGGFVPGPDAEW